MYEFAPCIACGLSDSSELADADAVRAEMEQLWSFHGRRLKTGVPVERLTDRVAFSQKPPLRLVRCDGCGTVYRNPRERAHVLADVYGGETPDDETLRALHETQRPAYEGEAERLTEVRGRPGRGLEVGSFVGGFLAAARDRGWTFEGLDVNPVSNAFTRSLGFRVSDGTLEEMAEQGEHDAAYDAVAIWNCFEQLADPRQSAAAARRLLRPGGILAVRVPNGAFYSAMRERLDGATAPVARGLLAHNNLLGFPYRHGFTAGALEWMLDAVGCEVVKVYGDALVPTADEWTRGWAALEERLVKGAMRAIARGDAERAPWMEVYARRVG